MNKQVGRLSAHSWFRIAGDFRGENGVGSLDELRVSRLLRDLRRCNRSQATIYHRRNLHVGFAHETASNRLSKLCFPQQPVLERVHLQIHRVLKSPSLSIINLPNLQKQISNIAPADFYAFVTNRKLKKI